MELTEKPDNQSVKDFLLLKTSEDLQQPLSLVERVIGWSYKDAYKATATNNEVEISGLGKLMVSQNKLRKRIQRIEEIQANLLNMPPFKDEKRETTRLIRIESNIEALKIYKSKLKPIDGIQENSGGMEKSPDTPSLPEGGNREGVQ